ncbi:hypothetical protein A2961_00750 [Candidatus Woesebacteria bacterium RIFCSPLOWO2_01_FULL_39_21]|uniref:M23ase beta-sheet core domain-containing protein n=1 Tax=Candidatus Woesebacteria bacterium RIFCSPLOWO2_01_FULL_39_21 TaxID=1802519 RepID=A0A1F8BNJ5_9BACT|nr:MAG: hypothetical protein A2691_02045 [Candidatus Woesebacteria bacterium RIFCSPHIGHO2_01_FULL_39_23]OGM65209.1 MAG: hypothetical protein A2961_00750 [Candidatus Woesebacteria bacterium RIFCSPLOWO2_01_FULL_39_21]
MATEILKSIAVLLKKQKDLAESSNFYSLPFPENTNVGHIVIDSPAHTGNLRGAIDFQVEVGTTIRVPLKGTVVAVADKYDQHGQTEKFANFLNEIVVKHDESEFSQVAHLAKGSALVKPGDEVIQGQTLARTGLSGWMTTPHLHFFVFTYVNGEIKGLKVKFRM